MVALGVHNASQLCKLFKILACEGGDDKLAGCVCGFRVLFFRTNSVQDVRSLQLCPLQTVKIRIAAKIITKGRGAIVTSKDFKECDNEKGIIGLGDIVKGNRERESLRERERNTKQLQ
eukprot:502127-Amphidinium_carterae.1